jgi:two-component system, NarL family, response regulator DevR
MSTIHVSTHSTGQKSARRPLRMMIVDDHEIVRHGLRDVISSITGFTIAAEASTCQEALEKVGQTDLDLIFVDLTLPDGDGIELIHTLRRSDAPPDIIVLTATVNDDILLEAMLAGASGYLTKDVPAAEIARLLQGFQRGEMVLTSAIASRLITMLVQKCQLLELSQGATTDETNVSPAAVREPQNAPAASPLQESQSSPLSQLTPQEERIFHFVRMGLSNKQIASRLSISRFTVGKHIQNILKKLGVTNRTQAVSHTSNEGGKIVSDLSEYMN